MKLNIKDYKITKTKKHFKTSKLFFFVNGTSRNFLDWLLIEQELKTLGFSYSKILNKTTLKALNNSVYKHAKTVVGGSTFLIKPKPIKPFLKQTILNSFKPLFFELLIVKFNNRIYSITSLNTVHSLEYKEIKLLLYQFNLTYLKFNYIISK